MSNKVKIFALGGLDENGKNMYCVEINNDIFVMEAGMKYPESSMPGIDMIIPDISYLIKNKQRVKGYLISHGHEDIMGALPYVYKEVPAPIYCSAITEVLIKASAKRYNMKPNYVFKTVEPNTKIRIEGHDVYFFSTTHSVSGSYGFGIDTGDGLVVYTSDFIVDYGALPQFRTDLVMLSTLREQKVLCLLTESVACDQIGHTSPHHKLTYLVEKDFEEHKGRIITAFYSQTLFGIREIIDLAMKYNRHICIYDEELRNVLHEVSRLGFLQIPPSLIVEKNEISRPGNENLVIIVSGIGEHVFRTLQLIAEGEASDNFTVRESDLYIIAAPAVPGIEGVAAGSIDALYKTGAKVRNISKKEMYSMHAHSEDIKMMVSTLQPRFYMPVKGEYRNLIANAQIVVGMQQGFNHKNTFVCDNGMVVSFEDGMYRGNQETVPVGDVLIDGLGIADIGSQVITDRQKLSDNGVLILGITVDPKKKVIVAGPDIQMRGLIFLKDAESFLDKLNQTFQEA
ncbi:MAG: ribonuclease J, partial [Bacilli bacterium]|nr:ribonuclease J [Bacilli bacterium]